MGRTPDLRCLNLRYTRLEMQPEAYSMEPNNLDFIPTISQKEFNTNSALELSKDQN